MEPLPISLSAKQRRRCDQIAQRWNDFARQRGPGRKVDQRRNNLEINQQGALGEAAAAVWLGVFDEWADLADRAEIATNQPDVGLFHVRSAAPERGLIVKPGDTAKPRDAYLLVWVVAPIRQTHIVGWAFGFEIKQPQFMRHDWPRPAYCMPANQTYSTDAAMRWHRSASTPQPPPRGLGPF